MTRRTPLLRIPQFRRTVGAAAIAVGALTGLTACDLFAPQDTLYIEEASVGVSATVGQVFVGNAVLVSGAGGSANLVVTLVNQSSEAQQVELATSNGQTIHVSLDPRATERLGNPPSEKTFISSLDAQPGSLTTVTVTSGDSSVGLQVPVITGALPPYGTLTPSPSGG
ncbi:hypothetical protein [Leifsonia sp. fls2-241-R2A-40a]|uniref:hypothetical protein n=1 Tax=Leifsonia sp. fls2-241-R2A-40a TaxID=3040290 RepID=UPI00254B2E0A|nr:hypothetical protein [Leifsonia sp. fls2-241-R2A-40a]